MSEKRILLASLLKPINDTRMYGKLGLSLCKLPDTQIHIAGYAAPAPAIVPANMFLHPIFSFKRLSLERFTAQRTFWKLLNTIKPELLIIGTHELLGIAWLYTRTHNCKIIYDIRENYSLNLTEQNAYNPILKRILAFGVRAIETMTAPFVEHFLLAEKSYADELSFLGNRHTIIENKYKPDINYQIRTTPVHINSDTTKLLISGTLSEVYGIFEAIKFVESWHKINSNISLTIIGYCSQNSTLQKLRQAIADKPYITLIGGDKLVPHSDILKVIATHDIGLLPYQPNPSTFRCIPTKLYEYMAYGLPILMQHNPMWQNLLIKADAGLTIDFNNYNLNNLLQSFYKHTYYKSGIPRNVFWNSEEQKLQNVVNEVLDQSKKEGDLNKFIFRRI